MYRIVAESNTLRQYVTKQTFLGEVHFTEDIQHAYTFEDQAAAETFALHHCDLYIKRMQYMWFIEEEREGRLRPVSLFADVPSSFETVLDFEGWLCTLYPFEEIGQLQGDRWYGFQLEKHPQIQAVELVPCLTASTVMSLLQELNSVDPYWRILNFHPDGHAWGTTAEYVRPYRWEVGNHLTARGTGFVTLTKTVQP